MVDYGFERYFVYEAGRFGFVRFSISRNWGIRVR